MRRGPSQYEFGRAWPKPGQLHSRYPDILYRWNDLVEIAPGLAYLGRFGPNERPVPVRMRDDAFLSFAACFASPNTREILRALILDLLSDDLSALLKPSARR